LKKVLKELAQPPLTSQRGRVEKVDASEGERKKKKFEGRKRNPQSFNNKGLDMFDVNSFSPRK
jgi:hypothetical protein